MARHEVNVLEVLCGRSNTETILQVARGRAPSQHCFGTWRAIPAKRQLLSLTCRDSRNAARLALSFMYKISVGSRNLQQYKGVAFRD